MGSVPKRHCARGEQCTQFPLLDKPQPLRATSKNDVCEACRSAESDAETTRAQRVARLKKSAPDERAYVRWFIEILRSRGYEVKASKDLEEVNRFVDLKHDLLVQIVLERGRFWEQIRDLRSRWNINPAVGIPATGDLMTFFRPQGLDREQWGRELVAIKERIVPRVHYRWVYGWWEEFISTCAFCEPPYCALSEYSAYFGVPLATPHINDSADGPSASGPFMVSPPIVPERLVGEDAERSLLRTALILFADRVSQGRDPYAAIDDVLGSRGLLEERAGAATPLPTRYYIDPEGVNNREQLRQARQVIQSKPSKGGRPPKGLLVAVECWYLHVIDEWTPEDLAQRYGWDSVDTATKQIEKGLEAVAEDR